MARSASHSNCNNLRRSATMDESFMKAVMGEEEKHLAHFAPHLKEDFLEIRGSLTDYEVRLVKLDHDKLYHVKSRDTKNSHRLPTAPLKDASLKQVVGRDDYFELQFTRVVIPHTWYIRTHRAAEWISAIRHNIILLNAPAVSMDHHHLKSGEVKRPTASKVLLGVIPLCGPGRSILELAIAIISAIEYTEKYSMASIELGQTVLATKNAIEDSDHEHGDDPELERFLVPVRNEMDSIHAFVEEHNNDHFLGRLVHHHANADKIKIFNTRLHNALQRFNTACLGLRKDVRAIKDVILGEAGAANTPN